MTAGAGAPGLGDVRVYSTSAGESVGLNKFTYIGPVMTVLGTNGAAIASGEAASVARGTDFGALSWGSALTNTLAITNSGNTNLTISGVTTNGAGAGAFSIFNFPFSINAGSVSNWTIRFTPLNAGAYTASVQIANDSTATPYIVYLAGMGTKHDQTITNFTPTNGSAFVTTSTVGLAAQVSSGLAVTNFIVGSGPGSISGLTNLAFTGSGSVSIVASQAGNTNWNAAPNVTNTFNVLPAPVLPVQDGWLLINVTPASGSWALSAPAGYLGPTSGTGNLAAVSAVTGQYAISYGALSGYVAPSNQNQFVTAGSTTLFAGVYLLVSTNIGTPTGVSATEGTYTNRIRVTWQGVAGASGYEIWRSQTNAADSAGRIADIPENSPLLLRLSEGRAKPPAEPQNDRWLTRDGSPYPQDRRLTGDGSPYRQDKPKTAYAYDDYAINPIDAYYYGVRAKTAALISPLSYVGMGYATLPPEQKTGAADIAVSDLVYLPVNLTNASPAGTVSCRVLNNGPDALNAATIGFDFHMSANTGALVWIGSAQSNYTLAAGAETLVILAPQAKRGLTVRGDLSGVQQVKVVVRHLSALNDPNLANNTAEAAGSVRIKALGVNSPGRSVNDYDGDGKSDGCLYQSALGRWYLELSGDRYDADVNLGGVGVGWSPAPGDYDGDGLTDLAAYDRLSGQWLTRFTSSGLLGEYWLGGPDFTAAPCDFDADGTTDPVVYRETDGHWYGLASSEQYAILREAFLGMPGYEPVAGDYDRDGKADPAAYDNARTGRWLLGPSSMGHILVTGVLGGPDWLAAAADYDGDGQTDPAVYAPATAEWQVLLSGSLATQGAYTWWDGVLGNINGLPVPADYDGDGLADPGVYHQVTGWWRIFLSSQAYQELSGLFGGPEYQPAKE